MANKGLQFEWCIYHLIAQANKTKFASDPTAKRAAAEYKTSGKDVQSGAANAIAMIQRLHGKITNVEKMSGGIEPKTDLVITTNRKTLKCSLKFGGSIQLSSAGIDTTTAFLSGVINNLKKTKVISNKKAQELLAFLSDMGTDIPTGTMLQPQIKKALEDNEQYTTQLQEILGSKKKPDVADEYKKIKLAVVEEALTGKATFAATPKKAAEWILSESSLEEITPKFVESIAKKTSVRLAAKGRGKTVVRGKEVRMNQISVRFDVT